MVWLALGLCLLAASFARAGVVTFFQGTQGANAAGSTATSETLATEGYLFTCTRDKLFTGGVGLTNPIGRPLRVSWPAGLEAQAVTSGPSPGGAKMQIRRQDGQPFAIESMTFKLLANTAGAGASLEVMPLWQGEDGVPDPFMFNATGNAGISFTYATPMLAGYDVYKLSLYVDFALMSLTVRDASVPPPALSVEPVEPGGLQLRWPANAAGYVLEWQTNLLATGWQRVTNVAVVDGDFHSLTLPAPGLRRFFRLRK